MNTISVMDLVQYVEKLKGESGQASLPQNLPAEINVSTFSNTKMVSKPWGFELWLAHGADLPYALKMLYIKQGTKTSLQFHHKKREHNVVFSGTIRFHHEDKITKQIVSNVFSAGSVINVNPPAVHRVEALTDVFLVEVSSPELDDVVRLDDDYKRPDGRIESEHGL